MRQRFVGCVIGVAVLCAVVRSNAQQTTRFEVATVTRNVSGSAAAGLDMSGGQVRATNLALRVLIRQAFDVIDSQIVNAPTWAADERYDVIAKAPEGITGAAMRPLLRMLLAERFKLATHTEMRDMPVYGLTKTASSTTPGLRETTRDCAANPGGGAAIDTADQWPMCSVSLKPGLLYIGGFRMSVVTRQLAGLVGRPVLDETSITTPVQFRLEYQPADLFTALEQQTGFKLVSKSAPVEVVVVDSAERPTAN